jgi:four helix bundle protein
LKKHNFRKLQIYQRAVEYAVEIYKLSKLFPKEELYGLTSQIRRAVISIALNIAEGSGNSSVKEFRRFLEIALRSTYEVTACLEIVLKLNFCDKEAFNRLVVEADEIAAMISGFSKSLTQTTEDR